jgi:hypothetical protein
VCKLLLNALEHMFPSQEMIYVSIYSHALDRGHNNYIRPIVIYHAAGWRFTIP